MATFVCQTLSQQRNRRGSGRKQATQVFRKRSESPLNAKGCALNANRESGEESPNAVFICLFCALLRLLVLSCPDPLPRCSSCCALPSGLPSGRRACLFRCLLASLLGSRLPDARCSCSIPDFLVDTTYDCGGCGLSEEFIASATSQASRRAKASLSTNGEEQTSNEKHSNENPQQRA